MAAHLALTDADRTAISQAVGRAEAKSAGEIVTILAARSDKYQDVALWWAVLIAGLALGVVTTFSGFYLGTIDQILGNWQTEWKPVQVLELALFVAVAKFLGTYLLLLWRPLRLLLVPRVIKHERVRARAITAFKIGAERRTHAQTGVLIYLSLDERRAEIVADRSIAEKVAPEVWGDAMAVLVGAIREGQPAKGLVGAIDRVGDVLAQHFPRDADDTNELPDRLIEV